MFGFGLVESYRYFHGVSDASLIPVPTITTQFSLSKAPSESIQGEIASMSGTVEWLSRTATKPVKIKSPQMIQQGEELSTGVNGNVDVVMKNDSVFSLTPNSHVNFVQLLPVNFVVEQDKGTVTYQDTSQVPISVKSFDLITIMTKGIYTVSVDPVNKTVVVTVDKGGVKEGYEDTQNTSNVVNLDAGQKFIFDDTTRVGTVTGNAISTPSFFTH